MKGVLWPFAIVALLRGSVALAITKTATETSGPQSSSSLLAEDSDNQDSDNQEYVVKVVDADVVPDLNQSSSPANISMITKSASKSKMVSSDASDSDEYVVKVVDADVVPDINQDDHAANLGMIAESTSRTHTVSKDASDDQEDVVRVVDADVVPELDDAKHALVQNANKSSVAETNVTPNVVDSDGEVVTKVVEADVVEDGASFKAKSSNVEKSHTISAKKSSTLNSEAEEKPVRKIDSKRSFGSNVEELTNKNEDDDDNDDEAVDGDVVQGPVNPHASLVQVATLKMVLADGQNLRGTH